MCSVTGCVARNQYIYNTKEGEENQVGKVQIGNMKGTGWKSEGYGSGKVISTP